MFARRSLGGPSGSRRPGGSRSIGPGVARGATLTCSCARVWSRAPTSDAGIAEGSSERPAPFFAPIAQLDRALVYGTRCRKFESSWARLRLLARRLATDGGAPAKRLAPMAASRAKRRAHTATHKRKPRGAPREARPRGWRVLSGYASDVCSRLSEWSRSERGSSRCCPRSSWCTRLPRPSGTSRRSVGPLDRRRS